MYGMNIKNMLNSLIISSHGTLESDNVYASHGQLSEQAVRACVLPSFRIYLLRSYTLPYDQELCWQSLIGFFKYYNFREL